MEKDMLDFYNKLLNIANENNDLQKIEFILENLDINFKSCENIEGLCKWFSHNISYELSKKHIYHNIINTSVLGSKFEHEFIVCLVKNDNVSNYCIIDPTYSQFLITTDKTLNPKLLDYPSTYLNSSLIGKELIINLVKKGYSIIDNNQINLYLKGFGIEDITLDDLITSKNLIK